MSEPKLISPLLDNFAMGDPISERNGIRCCPAIDNDSENKFIVKIISCPASQAKLDAMILSGAYPDVQSATAYFKTLAEDILNEAEILKKLSQLEGFLPYDGFQLVPMESEAGYDVYLLSKYRTTLAQHLRSSSMSHLDAINLGLDLCAALAVCRRLGYLYIDLKPENIYINNENAYRIGDIGFLRLDSLKYASIPERYLSIYTAPEITDAFSALNTTVDIYALGLILYQVFNGGKLPVIDVQENSVLPAPDYADYEMADIILKACDPDPEKRWQDPVEFGQALVNYMQKNGAHNTPIIPVLAVVSSESEQNEEPSEVLKTDSAISSDVDSETTQGDHQEAPTETDLISFEAENVSPADETQTHDPEAESSPVDELIITQEDEHDETLPGNDTTDIDYNNISEEVSDILNQADDLLAHPIPEPAVAPDPIVVVLPEQLPNNELSEESTKQTYAQDESLEASIQNDSENISVSNEDLSEQTPESKYNETLTDSESEDDDEFENDSAVDDSSGTKKGFGFVACIVAILSLLFVALVGYLFYTQYYLQPIHSFTVQDNTNGNITVLVGSNIADGELSVYCTDTYGNQLQQIITGGKAHFTGLKPDSPYTLSLDISGFHKLTGNTTLTVSTPPLTDIVQFLAVTGSEDGSAVLSFTVNGPDSEEWKLTYATAGETPQSVVFSDHIYTVTGLTLGNEYTFTLTPESVDEFIGVNVITHIASTVVKPENLQITGCLNNNLTAIWSAPDGAKISKWTARCFNNNGYDVTQSVTECSATFEGIDPSVPHTIEVTAEGMSVSEHIIAEANALTVYDIQTSADGTRNLNIKWNSSSAPQGGWLLQYTVDGSPLQTIEVPEGNQLTIASPVPGATYTFTLQAFNNAPVLGGNFVYTVAAAEEFSGYGVTSKNMTLSMCKTPNAKKWDRFDLAKSDYTNTFNVGEKASFLAKMNHKYKVSNDKITTLYVIRDKSGNVISQDSTIAAWKNMWRDNYCELDVPKLPSTEGKYTIAIYFNGALVHQQSFTVKK